MSKTEERDLHERPKGWNAQQCKAHAVDYQRQQSQARMLYIVDPPCVDDQARPDFRFIRSTVQSLAAKRIVARPIRGPKRLFGGSTSSFEPFYIREVFRSEPHYHKMPALALSQIEGRRVIL